LQYFFLFVLMILLTACSGPSSVIDDPESIRQTIGAFVTTFDSSEGSAEISQTQTQTLPGPSIVTETNTAPIPEIKMTNPAGTPDTPAPQNQATVTNNCTLAAGNPVDVTIPDGTILNPGQYFTKTWRLANTGGCQWTQTYAIVWFSGEDFESKPVQALGINTNPGESIEISIDMAAPANPGEYQGYWKLMSPEGHLFGIGPNGDAPFRVKVQVIQVETETPEPTPTTVPTAQVVASGEVALSPGNILDLDTGNLDPDKGDLSVELSQNGDLLLVPKNQTSLVFFGPNQPVEWECRLGTFSSTPLDLSTIKDGSSVCFRSSQGLPGYIIVNTQRYSERIMSVKFVTWFIP
jgi:hypothetical protein